MSPATDAIADDNLLTRPATDKGLQFLLNFGGNRHHFAKLPSPTAVSELAEHGLQLTDWDVSALTTAFRVFDHMPNLHATSANQDREVQIAKLCGQLANLLRDDDGGKEWRNVWGPTPDPDSEFYEAWSDSPEPEESLNVASFREDLETLQRSARERIAWLLSAKDTPIEPGGNRAPRTRYFYWLILIAFWRYHLRRDVGMSTGSEGQAYGPLIRFIQTMSSGGMEEVENEGSLIRAFVRRNAEKATEFRQYFDDFSER